MMGQFTEQGVVARRDATPDDLINEIRAAATARHTALLADPPTDPDAPAPGLFGAIGWSTLTLLRNRPLDLWMHEQDVRRAVGLPGGLGADAAAHSTDYLSESLGYVLAKRVGADPGTTVVLEVEGHAPVAATVTEEGRGPAARRGPRRADGRAAHRPRVLRPAGRRPPRARARPRRGLRRRRPRPPGPGRAGRHPVSGTPATSRRGRLDGRRHPRPDRAHRPRHRHHAGRAGPPHRPRAGPRRRPGGAGRSPRRPAGRDRRPRSAARSPRARLERLVVDLADLGSVRRAGDEATAVRTGRRARQQRRHHGRPAAPDRRRPRVADGDQPLRPVPAHRAAAAAGDRRRAAGWSPSPRPCTRSARQAPARRPAPAGGPLPPLAGLRRVQAGQPALHLRARPALPRGPACRSRRWPRTPASPARTWSPTASSGAPTGGAASILDAAVKAVSQSAAAGAWPTLMAATADLPGSTYVGPSGPGEMSGPPQVVDPPPPGDGPPTRSGGCGRSAKRSPASPTREGLPGVGAGP